MSVKTNLMLGASYHGPAVPGLFRAGAGALAPSDPAAFEALRRRQSEPSTRGVTVPPMKKFLCARCRTDFETNVTPPSISPAMLQDYPEGTFVPDVALYVCAACEKRMREGTDGRRLS